MKKKMKTAPRILLGFLCAAAMLCGALDFAVPDRIAVRPEKAAAIIRALGGEEATAAGLAESGRESFTVLCDAKLFGLLPIKSVEVSVYRNVELIPGGMPFGVKLYAEGVIVTGTGKVPCDGGSCSPAKDAGILARDVILAINGNAVHTTEEIIRLVNSGAGEVLHLTVARQGNTMNFEVTPVRSSADGKYKAGLWIRDSTAGIGTVTYIDPDTYGFAGLGHGICDGDTGDLVALTRGTIVNVAINGVIKGQAGFPGELKGYFSSGKIGTLLDNKECGVYGVFAELPVGCRDEAIPIALADEIQPGEAEILCTTDEGGVGFYKVMLSNIDRTGRKVKNFVVTVTDPTLLARTGGIVQGMSGSPIIQNGRLIGAVTHVLINDPT